MVFTAEKALKDAGDKVKDDVKKEVEEKIEAAKKLKDSDDLEAIKKATEELSTSMQKIGSAMNQGQPQPGQPGAEGAKGDAKADDKGDAKDKGPVDAEFEDVKDDKKEEKKK